MAPWKVTTLEARTDRISPHAFVPCISYIPDATNWNHNLALELIETHTYSMLLCLYSCQLTLVYFMGTISQSKSSFVSCLVHNDILSEICTFFIHTSRRGKWSFGLTLIVMIKCDIVFERPWPYGNDQCFSHRACQSALYLMEPISTCNELLMFTLYCSLWC